MSVDYYTDVHVLLGSSRKWLYVLLHHLYLASLSCRTFGSSVLWRPSRVLLTASLAPIIGFSTAIGTARTTERTGP